MLLGIDRHNTDLIAAVDATGGELTYGELVAMMKDVDANVHRRSLVFVLCGNKIGSVAWIMTLLEQRAVPLLLNEGIEEELLFNLIDKYRPQYLCSEVGASLLGDVVVQKYGYELREIEKVERIEMNEDLAYLLPTSGSTGSAKLVRHSYKNIDAAARNISQFFEIDENHRAFMVLPVYYTMGLSMVLSHLYAGAKLVMTHESMASAEFWAYFAEQKPTSFTGVPYSYEVLKMLRFTRKEMPHLKLLTHGGGKMSEALNEHFADYCEQYGKQWVATYGQTEGSARMAYLPAAYAKEKLGSIGKAVPNGELYLVDDKGERIETSGVEGELYYSGDNVTMGYAYTKEDLVRGDERNGLLATGDIAKRDDDGFYYIVSRKSRFVKLHGMRVSLDECERLIAGDLNIECACGGDDTKIVIYVTDESVVKEAKDVLVHKIHLLATSVEVIVIDKLPRNAAGKIIYKELRR